MCLLFLCQPFLCVKADKLHTAKCMVHVLLQTLNLPATLTLCTAHCKQAVQWCLCFYCSTQRDDETLTRFHPREVVDSTPGLAKRQLQALLTHVWCNRHNIKQHMSGLLLQACLSHPCCALVQASCAVLTVWQRGGSRWWSSTRRTSWIWTTPCWPGCWTQMLSPLSSGYVLLVHSYSAHLFSVCHCCCEQMVCWPGCWTQMLSPLSLGYVLPMRSHSAPPPINAVNTCCLHRPVDAGS